ncbi:hypothetical protein PF005_g21486 [Phytophthora fragariae]|uniref:Uncharacterized protein n=1 Tax=Phytophthora fragariae TaxID=53985 RepID=A0A6A3IY31_9STRA|nr:hypothetical protein PF003_g17016 [Phytophthora fragariae]KAE8927332.1 hypothetical protein PF009_g22499 [Phytophthora fragariae]KAE8986637.1 hypothetical protein PF011_g19905 [Phytophthora fragariae]KAE9084326.1 hypothetical protein PF007_g21565 [Phytophthora fragariae]KAE9084602.1 hypothetical protein PF010_g20764 [Phytophthora fragariae]
MSEVEEDVWGAAALRPTEPRRAGLKTLMMEEVKSSIRLLNAVSEELLAGESHEEEDGVSQAMTRVLGWLHGTIATPPLHTETSYRPVEEERKETQLSTLKELLQVFLHWHKQQQTMSWRLWMLWAELGCSLDVLRCCEVPDAKATSFSDIVMSAQPPRGFPTSETHCNKEKQVAFSCELWDAVVAKPLHGAPTGAYDAVSTKLIDLYLQWMTAAMRGYEVAFIANVGAPLSAHLRASTNNSQLPDTWLKFANFKMGPGCIAKNAAGVAITVVVLSALTSAHRAPEVAGYLESLSAAVVEELSRGLFPQHHSPVAIAAMALGLAALDDARLPSSHAIQLQGGNTTLLSQFAVLRLLSLQLLSSRLKPCDDATKFDYQQEVHRRVQALVAEPSHAVLQEYSLRMTEACIEEMVGFFQTSLGAHLGLVEAAQYVLPAELFRSNMLTKLQSTADRTAQDESLLTSAPEIVAFLKQFYGGVAPILEVLSTGELVRVFLALSRIEFAREVCASAAANGSMQTVTQRLEQALEQTTAPPEAIFAPVFRSLAMHSMTANAAIPREVDIVAGCQALAVGLVMQRKLRILLFQCASLIDDALAVVFSGLYNVFEPVDAFAHRFLGVCLTHLTQFTPLFTVFPHYLQVTLAAYPANASRQALTKACGAIFGSLFYSEALTMPTENNSEIVETAQRMVLWAVRKCCDRSSELLAEENKHVNEAAGADSPTTKSGEKADGKDAAVSETDGLYLAGLVFEPMKMAPMDILQASAMEAEQLLARWKSNPRILRELKSALFARISQNCEAEKRAWFAAWYIEVDRLYPVEPVKPTTSSRL